MSRRVLVGFGAVGVLIFVAVGIVQWLPGPRSAVPPGGSPSNGSAPPRSPVGLPDPARTPGSVNPNVTSADLSTTICKSGWTATVRPPAAYTNALKLVQIVEYGYPDKDPRHYQEDHLVPLELGGAPRDPKNLWPEPNTLVLSDGEAVDSDAKDHLENYLHRKVCDGELALGDAQRLIAGDWVRAWEDAGRP